MDANTAQVLTTLIMTAGIVGGIWGFFWGLGKLAGAGGSIDLPEQPTYVTKTTTWYYGDDDDDDDFDDDEPDDTPDGDTEKEGARWN